MRLTVAHLEHFQPTAVGFHDDYDYALCQELDVGAFVVVAVVVELAGIAAVAGTAAAVAGTAAAAAGTVVAAGIVVAGPAGTGSVDTAVPVAANAN